MTTPSGSRYEPYGWHHWPDYPWMSYQFRRALGEAQVGGGTVSESFLAASRMDPSDRDSWHREWRRVADASRDAARAAEGRRHFATARDGWLRATDQYRSAEFWLDPDDPRRLETFDQCERSFRNAGRFFRPEIEQVRVPYLDGQVLHAHLLKSPRARDPQPLLIAVGGLDSFKEELLFMVGRAALDRGIACLLVDGPGQGATLRREGIANRFDFEVPVGACLDWLATRADIDQDRIALSGSSLGGYYAARAGSFEHRLAAVVSHGAQWDLGQQWADRGEDHGLAMHIKWVFGAGTVAEAKEKARAFRLAGVIEGMTCPYLIVHGGHDVLGVRHATSLYEYAREHGVNVEFRVVSADETGAEHCQHDNPTIGMEIIADWLCDRFKIDQSTVLGAPQPG